MGIDEFVKNFSELFEETDARGFKPSTQFREIEEWSSLLALSVIAMVDEKYHVSLTGDDIRNSTDINDIFNIVKTK
ncbi:MAG: acyl carrier protein [Bacteroidales bacterium]|jgi:acyl carrier protein